MVSEPHRSMASSDTTSPSASTNGTHGGAAAQPQHFSNPVSFKLKDDNYLPWKQEALATIKGYKLQKFLIKEQIPKKFLSEEDELIGNISSAFLDWEQQDSLLLSWLLASLNESLRVRMVGCEFSYQIWEKIEKIFAAQTRARIQQLKI